ncbi:MAG: hypothetical protein MUF49_26405 [Oculatellaceae cyanobacterium Prado106]|jgi:hypothetical protein|nr:hypothetical protein [Oculatellaceae cyanobacterium Prado106]
MSSFSFSDDRPPLQVSSIDRLFHRQLEEVIHHCFWEGCDRITQELLTECDWELHKSLDCLILTIHSPAPLAYWHMVSQSQELEKQLKHFSNNVIIRIIPSSKDGIIYELKVHANDDTD